MLICMGVGFLEKISQGKRYPNMGIGSARKSQLIGLELAIYTILVTAKLHLKRLLRNLLYPLLIVRF